MNEEELALLTSHSTVLADEDIDELKDSDVIREFEGISLKAIFEGRETFQEFDKLIRILNLSFKYDIDLYPQLLTFLVRKYVLKCRNNASTLKGVVNPVMKDIKKTINNEGLYNYLFTGNPVDLRPEDIFRSKELLSVSTQHFEEKDFTSEVVAEGVSRITSLKEAVEMFRQLEDYSFVVVYEDLVKASIDKDNVTLLNYLVTKHEDKKPTKDIVLVTGEVTYGRKDKNYIRYIALTGSLNCLKYAYENEGASIWDKTTCSNAALNGHLDCLKYAHEKGGASLWDEETCSNAALNGHLDCLKYAHEKGCPWDKTTCSNAAFNGHLDCLKYAHEKGGASLWDEETCSNAALNGHLDCLKYAHENGCPWYEETCSNAALNGHLDCIKYAHENDCPLGEETCSNAALNGHLDCIKYAHENDCPLGEWSCVEAVRGGHLNCLKYAHENGGYWDEFTCSEAARGGHLECLKYAHENDCPWDKRTCSYAASNGHLDCLKYAHENGGASLWNEETCINAVNGGHLECLKYAHENGCPWDERIFHFYAFGRHEDCLQYARDNGCPR
jgi:hypothetical protein